MVMFLTVGVVEAAEFTAEQSAKFFDMTVANPAATEEPSLPLDAATFQMNFNAFITDFLGTVSTGNDFAEMQSALSLNNPVVTAREDGTIFSKNFWNRVSIVGFSGTDGKLKVLNFFATQPDSQEESLYHVLILRAFVKSISPDYDAATLLGDLKKNPIVIRNDICYTIARVGNLNIITATSAAP